MKNIFSFLLLAIACAFQNTSAQPKASEREFIYPEIGKPCPDFILDEVHYYSSKKASLQDFKGKWLILDFWSRWCTACIASFPETNELNKEFRDKVQFVLVGLADDKIRPLYEKFRKKYDLNLAVAYDSTLYKKFGALSFPHIIWIDDTGIVRAITDNTEMKAENIKAFLNGSNPVLTKKNDLITTEPAKPEYDRRKPFLVDGNGGSDTDFLYRSVLAQWTSDLPTGYPGYFTPGSRSNEIFVSGAPLMWLYQMAYGDTIQMKPIAERNSYGSYWNDPVLEISDQAPFKTDATGKNMYCYDLIVPPGKNKKTTMQKMMQRDLQNYFGYKVTVETRMMPCWKLTAANGAAEKLRSQGKHEPIGGDANTQTILKDEPMFKLIQILWAPGPNQIGPPIIDETGIRHKIDLTLDAILNDMDDVKKGLKKNGLILEKSQKEMKVIVIRD